MNTILTVLKVLLLGCGMLFLIGVLEVVSYPLPNKRAITVYRESERLDPRVRDDLRDALSEARRGSTQRIFIEDHYTVQLIRPYWLDWIR